MNYHELIQLFETKLPTEDTQKIAAFENLLKTEKFFNLDGQTERPLVHISSVPRSGRHALTKILEEITGVIPRCGEFD